jgi:two-component system alkaline phosphatase synthesis response regulator PhoP
MVSIITETIRLQNIDVPILILSAKNTSADRVLGLKKGADDYLTKPFNLEELILRVQKLIEKNKKLQDRSSLVTHTVSAKTQLISSTGGHNKKAGKKFN